MAASNAATVEEYLAGLPADRREAIERVRDTVRASMPEGYREAMAFGMITWSIPLETYPDTYNGQPLGYVALASQKNYMALHLMGAYADSEQRRQLEDAYARAGKRMDMGKSCLRFKRAEDLPLELIGTLVASTPPERMIELAEASRRR